MPREPDQPHGRLPDGGGHEELHRGEHPARCVGVCTSCGDVGVGGGIGQMAFGGSEFVGTYMSHVLNTLLTYPPTLPSYLPSYLVSYLSTYHPAHRNVDIGTYTAHSGGYYSQKIPI